MAQEKPSPPFIDLWIVTRLFCRTRTLIFLFALAYSLTAQSFWPRYSIIALTLLIGLYNSIAYFASLRHSTNIGPITKATLAADIAVGIGFLWLTADQPSSAAWVLYVLVGVEAAVLYGRRGMLVFSSCFLAAYLLYLTERWYMFGLINSPYSIAFQIGLVMLLSGLVAELTDRLRLEHTFYLKAEKTRQEQEKIHRDELEHLAFFDSLSGLPNRLLFMDRLEQSLRMAKRTGKELAVLMIDLNRFKDINDTYGHLAGDVVLQQFAARLQDSLRQSDTPGRIGGDEFAVLLGSVEGIAGAAYVVDKIQQALLPFIRVNGQNITLRASIGIALTKPSDTLENLLARADDDMYRAKRLIA